ncbi:MAG: hypothetical protein QW711_05830 [Candidatus Korarchaeum sp.]
MRASVLYHHPSPSARVRLSLYVFLAGYPNEVITTKEIRLHLANEGAGHSFGCQLTQELILKGVLKPIKRGTHVIDRDALKREIRMFLGINETTLPLFSLALTQDELEKIAQRAVIETRKR